jgi:Tfp pilus assembly protein PilO
LLGVPVMKFKIIYIWFSLPFILIIIWVLAFYMPLSSKIKVREKEILSIKQQIQTINSNINNIIQMEKKGADTRQLVNNLSGEIPLFDEFPDFMVKLAKSTKDKGISLDILNSLVTSADFEKKTFLVNPVFEVGLKGKYLSMGKFLEDLASQMVFKKILKAHISYNEKEYPNLTGMFVIEFKAWRQRISIEGK